MKKPAFTMLELVFVIVVLGILAALAMPRLERDLRQEAKDNLLSAIRYTQHLALTDDKTDPTNASWQVNLWKIAIGSTSYTISSDAGANVAKDPINAQAMDGTSPNTKISKLYSVTGVTGTCSDGTVAFDNLGRPFTGTLAGSSYANYLQADCTIIVAFSEVSSPLTITIAAETGRVSSD